MRPYKMVPDRNGSERDGIILPAYWLAVVLFHDKRGKQSESYPSLFIRGRIFNSTTGHPETTEYDYCVGNVVSGNGTSLRRQLRKAYISL